jgi:hypothetical protein
VKKVYLGLSITCAVASYFNPWMAVSTLVFAGLLVIETKSHINALKGRINSLEMMFAETEAQMVTLEVLVPIREKLAEIERSVGNLRNSRILK